MPILRCSGINHLGFPHKEASCDRPTYPTTEIAGARLSQQPQYALVSFFFAPPSYLTRLQPTKTAHIQILHTFHTVRRLLKRHYVCSLLLNSHRPTLSPKARPWSNTSIENEALWCPPPSPRTDFQQLSHGRRPTGHHPFRARTHSPIHARSLLTAVSCIRAPFCV